MIRVGIIGLGSMGSTHLDIYTKHPEAKIVALSDIDGQRLAGKAQAKGNIEGQAQGQTRQSDLDQAARYGEAMELIADDQVDLVDICLPTPLHRAYFEAALAAGKHVMVEKPLGRTVEDGRAMAQAARNAPAMTMVGQCMRFWPGWDWLKKCVDEQTYGPVLAAAFTRLGSHPGGPFYGDGEACGGALLDLHIHDADFVQYCFGRPEAVYSRGYCSQTSEPDHVLTHYLYGLGGPMISAEGGWAQAEGFGFHMHYRVNFERATAVFDLAADDRLVLYTDGQRQPVEIADGLGYEHEIAYLLDCIKSGQPPRRITVDSAADSLALVQAEHQSLDTGQVTPV